MEVLFSDSWKLSKGRDFFPFSQKMEQVEYQDESESTNFG